MNILIGNHNSKVFVLQAHVSTINFKIIVKAVLSVDNRDRDKHKYSHPHLNNSKVIKKKA